MSSQNKKLSVLVASAFESVGGFISMISLMKEHNVEVATNCEEVIELSRRKNYDLAFICYNLGYNARGLNGIQASGHLMRKETPIYFIRKNPDPPERELITQGGEEILTLDSDFYTNLLKIFEEHER